jgi:hypothetical protein
MSGAFTGTGDEHFTFRPTSDGTIGTTPGLTVEVLDRAGNHVTTLDVGAGYVPGTELDLGQGLKVSFGLGELSASQGDFLAVDAVSDSDSSDVLVALGLNTLLSGKDASDIAVRADLAADPSQLAVSLTGADGDGGLLLDMMDIEKHGSSELGGATLGRYWGDSRARRLRISLADSAISSGQP